MAGTEEALPAADRPAADADDTLVLLACGIAAGPLFLTVGLTQAFIRDGFDLSRHPLSLLSLGDLGSAAGRRPRGRAGHGRGVRRRRRRRLPPGRARRGSPDQLARRPPRDRVRARTLGVFAGCLVFARRLAGLRQWGWVGGCIASAVAVLVLAAHLLRGLPDRTG